MPTPKEKAERFLELHVPGSPLRLVNPWDVGSAVLLASLGFEALATTSGGFAATLGRLDGSAVRHRRRRQVGSAVDRDVGRPTRQRPRPTGHPLGRRARRARNRPCVGRGSLAYAALGAAVDAALELRDRGTYGYLERAVAGRASIQTAFG